MAKKSMIAKAQQDKFQVRKVNRCRICGRPRGYMRRFKCTVYASGKYASGRFRVTKSAGRDGSSERRFPEW